MARHPNFFSTFSPQHFTMFGLIVYQFAIFDATLDGIIADLYGIDHINALFFSSLLMYQAKRDLLNAAIKRRRKFTLHHRSRFFSDLEKILNEAEPLANFRNDIAHGLWRPGARKGSN